MNRIFIGYDHRQPVSYTVLQHSIISRCKKAPVSISPLILKTLPPIKKAGLTPFTYSRFLAPMLCGYEGWSLFLDIDQLVLADINELFELKDDRCDVMAVKNPDPAMKFELASVMLFNNEKCRKLTPEFIESFGKLHTLDWAENIGELPSEWNHLVGYDKPRTDAKLVHFTQGVPAWPETEDSNYAHEWRQDATAALSSISWQALMGNSVHAKPVYERLKLQGQKVAGAAD